MCTWHGTYTCCVRITDTDSGGEWLLECQWWSSVCDVHDELNLFSALCNLCSVNHLTLCCLHTFSAAASSKQQCNGTIRCVSLQWEVGTQFWYVYRNDLLCDGMSVYLLCCWLERVKQWDPHSFLLLVTHSGLRTTLCGDLQSLPHWKTENTLTLHLLHRNVEQLLWCMSIKMTLYILLVVVCIMYTLESLTALQLNAQL